MFSLYRFWCGGHYGAQLKYLLFQIWTLLTKVVMLTRTPQLNPTEEHLSRQMVLYKDFLL